MKALSSQSRAAVAFLMLFPVLMAIPARTQGGNGCRLDRQQWQQNTSAPLGGERMLAQSFTPILARPVCKVKVYIAKTNPAAGPLILNILNANRDVIDSATIAAVDIPMGASVQLFDFECDGARLLGAPFWLRLESPGSALGHYRWFGIGGNAFAAGEAWSNAAGNARPLSNGDADFMFKLYLCND
jgi:hypothetical protein